MGGQMMTAPHAPLVLDFDAVRLSEGEQPPPWRVAAIGMVDQGSVPERIDDLAADLSRDFLGPLLVPHQKLGVWPRLELRHLDVFAVAPFPFMPFVVADTPPHDRLQDNEISRRVSGVPLHNLSVGLPREMLCDGRKELSIGLSLIAGHRSTLRIQHGKTGWRDPPQVKRMFGGLKEAVRLQCGETAKRRVIVGKPKHRRIALIATPEMAKRVKGRFVERSIPASEAGFHVYSRCP
jgi:hypothetical protein